MRGTCFIFYEIARTFQGVVEDLFGLLELLCGPSTTIPVGPCPIVGIVCLPRQVDGLHARIRQTVTRYLLASTLPKFSLFLFLLAFFSTSLRCSLLS